MSSCSIAAESTSLHLFEHVHRAKSREPWSGDGRSVASAILPPVFDPVVNELP